MMLRSDAAVEVSPHESLYDGKTLTDLTHGPDAVEDPDLSMELGGLFRFRAI
jgi:hypothetical protein